MHVYLFKSNRWYIGVSSCDYRLVCRNINEDKRKAEGHQVMFEIVNDIENCPVCSCVMTELACHSLSWNWSSFVVLICVFHLWSIVYEHLCMITTMIVVWSCRSCHGQSCFCEVTDSFLCMYNVFSGTLNPTHFAVYVLFYVWLYIACMCSTVTWWGGPAGIEGWSLGPLLPSVLWHCWLGHLTCKTCPRYDLWCV